VSEPALDAALRDLGRHLTWPPTPDVVPAVRARLEQGAEVRLIPRRPLRRGMVVAAAALLVLLAGSVVLSPAIRAALLRLFTLPGVRIEVTESPTEPAEQPSVEVPFLGRRVSLEQARGEVPFPIALPDDLGQPDEVYLAGGGDRALVTLAYRRAPNITTDPRTGYAVLLTQLRGSPSVDLIKKTAVETRVMPVTVGGERGYFVEGEHTVYVLDPEDQPLVDEARIAGNTLLWTQGEVTLRLEADVPLPHALGIARSVG
jgi:hypothetical protein